VSAIGHLLGPIFIQRALLAGTAIALVSGLVGHFVILRAQVFAADALSHVAFTGAVAALAAGVDLRFGLFAATIAVGLLLGVLGGRSGPGSDDATTGVVFAWILGLGVFFLAYFTAHSSSGNGAAGVRVLFGSVFGLSAATVVLAVVVALAVVLALAIIARPLLFASLDPAVAAARGVPVRWLGTGFLALVGVTAAEASQAVGALLLFALVAAPPAAAQRLTSRPWPAFALSGGLAVVAIWLGVGASYAWDRLPPSFSITAVASLELLVATAWSLTGHRRAGQRRLTPSAGDSDRRSPRCG